MKIAYFTESLPPKTDGVAHTLTRLIETLLARDERFVFFSPFKPDGSVDWSDRVRKVPSIPFLLYREYRITGPLTGRMRAELDRFAPDIVHIACPSIMGVSFLNYARKRNIPAVSSYHTHFVTYFPYYGFPFLIDIGWKYFRWFHNRCRANFAPSPSAARELESKGIRNIEIWPRGIDLKKFSPSYRDTALRESIQAGDDPVLLFVGRLVKEKDIDDLIQADKNLRSWGYRYKLVIVGDGPMRREIETEIPHAHLTGYRHGEELSKWFASADIFVFPSTTETFGNVIQEAFASGIPAVGVREGGVSDLIEPGTTGFLAEPRCGRDFAEKIRLLLDNPSLRKTMGENAIKAASQNSWSTINGKLLNHYEKVIENHRRD